VYVIAVHWAKSVMLEVGVYEPPADTANEPPDDAVYHPLKVNPERVGVGAVTVTPLLEAGETEPPLAFQVTVYVVVVTELLVPVAEPAAPPRV
jgi:hypothetical protein